MAESPQADAQSESSETRRRRSAARNAFPRVSIPKVLPLLDAIWSHGHGESVRTTTAFATLGRSHNSGTARTLIASANSGYGLLTGNANAPYLGLTQAGKSIADPSSKEDRTDAIVNALFTNDIFRAVHGRYLDKALPSDQVVSDFIRQDAGLSEEDATACWGVISENMRFAGLLIKEGGRDVVVSRQDATPVTQTHPSPETPQPQAVSVSEDHVSPASSFDHSVVGLPQAEFHFNVQIHLPNDADPETYDAIFASIAKNLLQRKA